MFCGSTKQWFGEIIGAWLSPVHVLNLDKEQAFDVLVVFMHFHHFDHLKPLLYLKD